MSSNNYFNTYQDDIKSLKSNPIYIKSANVAHLQPIVYIENFALPKS